MKLTSYCKHTCRFTDREKKTTFKNDPDSKQRCNHTHIKIATAFLTQPKLDGRGARAYQMQATSEKTAPSFLLYSSSKRKRDKRIHVCNQTHLFCPEICTSQYNEASSHATSWLHQAPWHPSEEWTACLPALHNPQRRGDVKIPNIIDGWEGADIVI